MQVQMWYPINLGNLENLVNPAAEWYQLSQSEWGHVFLSVGVLPEEVRLL